MSKYSQQGFVGVAGILAVILGVFFVAATIFAFWALAGKNDYKSNTDKKIATAVDVAVKKANTEKDNEFIEKNKSPVKTYIAAETVGSLSFDYPKSYSAYIVESNSGLNSAVNGYFYPDIVPNIDDSSNSFALRVQVLNTGYSTSLKQFEAAIKSAKVKAEAFKPSKVPSVLGVRLNGEIITGKNGSMVILPLRDKTLKIWTEAPEFKADFDKYVVPSINFIP